MDMLFYFSAILKKNRSNILVESINLSAFLLAEKQIERFLSQMSHLYLFILYLLDYEHYIKFGRVGGRNKNKISYLVV